MGQSPKLIANASTPSIRIWYVENDALGRKGYAGGDARLLELPTNGGGLFESIQALNEARKSQGLTKIYIEPSYGRAAPHGWRIRDLTFEEISAIIEFND